MVFHQPLPMDRYLGYCVCTSFVNPSRLSLGLLG